MAGSLFEADKHTARAWKNAAEQLKQIIGSDAGRAVTVEMFLRENNENKLAIYSGNHEIMDKLKSAKKDSSFYKLIEDKIKTTEEPGCSLSKTENSLSAAGGNLTTAISALAGSGGGGSNRLYSVADKPLSGATFTTVFKG